MRMEYDQRTRPVSMAQMHAHEDVELYFLVSGQRRYFVGDTIYDVEPGDMVLIPGNQLHRTVATGKFERYVLYFNQDECEAFVQLIGKAPLEKLLQSGCLQFSKQVSEQIGEDFRKLYKELSENRSYREGMCRHLLNDILLCALRSGAPKNASPGENTNKIQEVARYISQNYARQITLETAADLACMERTYFSKQFKALTGFGFQEYLTQVRLLAAQQMLEHSDLSVTQVAEACGFGGGNYFGDVFRKYRGVSPSRYRKKRK